MLSRFRKRPKLTDRDADARRKALDQLSEPNAEEHKHLEHIARSDDSAELRVRAIGWVKNDPLLGELLDDPIEKVALAAASRIATLLAGSAATAHAGHPLVMGSQLAAGVLPEPALLGAADPGLLADYALAARDDTRQSLLGSEAFRRSSVLTQLEKRSRAKDKSLNRYAREQLERVRQLRASFKQETSRLEEVLAALDKHHNASPDSPAYRDKLLALTGQAEALVSSLGETAENLAGYGEQTQALDTLRQQFEALPAVDVDTAPETATPAGAAADTATSPVTTPVASPVAVTTTLPAGSAFEELVIAFEALDAGMHATAGFDSLARQRQQLTERWLAAADQQPPLDAQHRVFKAVSHRFGLLADAHARLVEHALPEPPAEALETRLPTAPGQADGFWQAVERLRRWQRQVSKALEQLQWPDWAPSPAQVQQLNERLKTSQAQLDEISAAVDAARETFDAALRELAASVDAGASQNARQLLNQARTLLRQLPRRVAAELTPLLNHEAARVSELKDWQTYVTTPKRESLCEAISALAEQPHHPPDQAQRIKELRAQWSELGAINSAADRELATRFNQLAEKAFEPCREYFAELSSQRAANLAAREGICQQLEAYLSSTNWDDTDIKAAETILRTAREEWRRYHPVDRKPGKPIEDRFEALQTRLHKHIATRWESNLDQKKAIVEAARALLEEAVPMAEKINGAKNLQQRWRAVGPTPRKPDQALWRQFRAACDEIFNARDTAQAQADEALRKTLTDAEKLLTDFARTLDTSTPSAAELRSFGQAFRGLPALPERQQRALEKRFAELERDCHNRLRAAASAARLDELRALVAADADNTHGAPEVSLEDLKRMTVEAEIAAGLESAPEDNQLRLSIQVELMNAGLGRRAFDVDPLELATQWCELGPKPADAGNLRDRFLEALITLASN